MIRKASQKDLKECTKVIQESFLTVAVEFGITQKNAPRFTAFSTTEEKLLKQFIEEHRPMYVYYDQDKIKGYYSLAFLNSSECELNNLSVLPEYRHNGIGHKLLLHSFSTAKEFGFESMIISIVEENKVLKKWYESFDVNDIGTKKFDFFPFTCGYLRKNL